MSRTPADGTGGPRWPLLLLILSVTAVAQLSFAAVPPVLPELAEALRVSRGAIGLVHGMVAVAGIFLAAYMGYLLDRFGRRRMIRFSLVLFGLAGAACFFAAEYWQMLLLRLLQGVGASTLLSVGMVLVGDQYQGYRRRWALGLNVASMTVAGTLFPIAAGALGEGGAFRPFLLYLLAFPVWWAARRLPEPSHAPSLVAPGRHLREALADLRQRGRLSDFLGLLPMGFLSLAVYLGLSQALFPLFLEREYGVGAFSRGLLLAVGTGAAAVASALSGRMSGRVRPGRAVVGGLTLEMAGFLVIGLASPLWAVTLGLGLVGLGYGALTPVLQHFATSAGRDQYRGALVGTWVSGNRVGMFAGPSVATALAGSLGDRNTYLAGTAVVAVMAVSLLPVRRLAARRMHRAAGPSGPASGSSGPASGGAT